MFSPKDPAEIITLTFDFAALTMTPTLPVVTVSALTYSADPSPSGILYGSPAVTGAKITQMIRNGVSGVYYEVTCQVDSGGERYTMTEVLPVLRQF